MATCLHTVDHASTYGAKDILAEIPSVWTALIGHLLKALAKDSSDDVLGRTSHVLRYAPEHAKKLLVDDRTLRHKWKFPDPEELATEPLRPALVNFIQIGLLLGAPRRRGSGCVHEPTARNPARCERSRCVEYTPCETRPCKTDGIASAEGRGADREPEAISSVAQVHF